MKICAILEAKGTSVATARPDITVASAIRTLQERGIGSLIVTENGNTVDGLVSERDIVRGLETHGPELLDLPVSEVMTCPVVACGPDDTVHTAMNEMTRCRVRHLPVVDGGRLCGIISIGDVVKHRLDELEMETNVLRDAFISRQ